MPLFLLIGLQTVLMRVGSRLAGNIVPIFHGKLGGLTMSVHHWSLAEDEEVVEVAVDVIMLSV